MTRSALSRALLCPGSFSLAFWAEIRPTRKLNTSDGTFIKVQGTSEAIRLGLENVEDILEDLGPALK
jgi:hypothetical protein